MSEKVFLDNHRILNWTPENPTGDIAGTRLSLDVMQSLLDEHGPLSILVDLSKAPLPSPEQRAMEINSLQINAHRIKKIALFGHTPLLKVVAYYIIHATNFDAMKFFNSRTEAVAWLRE